MTVTEPVGPRAGGSFLIERHEPATIQVPEERGDELRLMAHSARQFVERELLSEADKLEVVDYDFLRQKLQRAGEQGLLGVDVPEEHGGLAASKTASMLVAEQLASSGSFNVTFNAHTGIGTLPIVYFGTSEQQERYLPKLATGEMVAAYCLTEPDSGSDARAARARAVLDEDGRTYRLSGTKMWITNAGFADLFVVFAQAQGPAGEGLTAFLVERETPGLSFGAEEHKLGISGSSTRQVILEDAPVPVGNVLGEVGKGHRIAFSILNLGRLKLAAGAVGGVKEMVRLSSRYALGREQFGQPIARFGLIREKIANMTSDAYALESALYRLAGELDRRLGQAGDEQARQLAAIDEYVVEYSLIKVYGSEILDDAVDEAMQIYGGNGYSAEYPIETAYRNSRINRIFEGTNEINRLLVTGQLLRRALSGRLDLLTAGQAALQGGSGFATGSSRHDDDPLSRAGALVEGLKQAVLLLATSAAMEYGEGIETEQEIMARLADGVSLVYLAESGVLRASRLAASAPDRARPATLAARLYAGRAVDRFRYLAQEVLARVEGAGERADLLGSYLAPHGEDLIELRRQLSEVVYEAQGYPLK